MKKTIILYVGIIVVAVLVNLIVGPLGDPHPAASASPHPVWGLYTQLGDLFLKTFNSRTAAFVLVSCILVAACLICCVFWFWRVLPLRREITQVRAGLILLRNDLGHAEFRARMDEMFRAAPLLMPAWQRWARNLYAVSAPPDQRIQALVSSSDIFSLTQVDNKGLPFTLYRKLPDFFVGIGLVFTFCGLVAGLYFAGNGLTTGDLAAAKSNLMYLLNASTFKFLTSIAGVSASLLVTFVVQVGLESVRRGLDILTLELDELVPPYIDHAQATSAPASSSVVASRRIGK